MNDRLSAVLLAGGRSRRMGRDKSFLEFNRIPLWQHQVATLQELHPDEIIIAGPPRPEWTAAGCKIVPDAAENAGPLAGLVAALRISSAPRLVLLAIDLPHLRADFLRRLLAASTAEIGAVPKSGYGFEPLVAVYPKTVLPLAERQLLAGRYALQDFVRAAIRNALVREFPIHPAEQPLFHNLNTPNDLARSA